MVGEWVMALGLPHQQRNSRHSTRELLCFDRLMFFFVCFFSPQILNPQLMIYHPLIKHGLNIHEWIVNRCFLSMKSLEIIYKRMIWYGFNGILMRILMVNKWMTNQSIYGGCTSQPYLMTARLMGFTSMAFLWYESGITGRKRLKITITHIQFI